MPLIPSNVQPDPTPPTEGELAAGTDVGEYTIQRKLGQGGMGAVYLAVHRVIGRRAAIKVLSATIPGGVAAGQRFLNEARATAAIEHPHIVSVFDFGLLPDRRPYYVMEFLDGRTLARRLLDDDLAADETRRLLLEICDALAATHARGTVHRDLKPDNIWIAHPPQGQSHVKILDFGLVKFEGSEKVTRTGTVMGSPGYMAPEQCAGVAADHRTDLYSLGVILYEMFAGRLPFQSDLMLSHMAKPPPPPSRFCPLPPPLEELILHCLEKRPADRPQEISVVAARLSLALGPGGLRPSPRRWGQQTDDQLGIEPTAPSVAAKPGATSPPPSLGRADTAPAAATRGTGEPAASQMARVRVPRRSLFVVAALLGAVAVTGVVWSARMRPPPPERDPAALPAAAVQPLLAAPDATAAQRPAIRPVIEAVDPLAKPPRKPPDPAAASAPKRRHERVAVLPEPGPTPKSAAPVAPPAPAPEMVDEIIRTYQK